MSGILLTAAGLTASLPTAALADETTVRLAAGLIEGSQADGVRVFRGVPYAAPPVGDLRWRAPQPPSPWQAPRAALRFAPVCMQPAPPADVSMDEDCLYLNVWAPPRGAGPHPVMVWIHGGSFVGGSGSAPVYDGSALARRGVVVVTLNYRLGRFGFFAHPALDRARPAAELSANFGLLDQLAALRWVRDNIGTVGGDAGNVTVFGESSGGAAVLRLMITPAARGLFHRAIVQSGNGRDLMPRLDTGNADSLPSALRAGEAFAAELGLVDPTARALRQLPAAVIVGAGERTAIEGGPILDGRLLRSDVGEAFARGEQAAVPLLVGATSHELPIAAEGFEAVWQRALAFDARERRRIEAAYADMAEFRRYALSDVVFVEPARFLARAHAAHGLPAYLYRFDVLSVAARERFLGTPHARELAYVFGTLDTLEWPVDESDRLRSQEVISYWTNFARAGNPNADALPHWPRYTPRNDQLLELSNVGPRAQPVPNRSRLDAIAALYDDSPSVDEARF